MRVAVTDGVVDTVIVIDGVILGVKLGVGDTVLVGVMESPGVGGLLGVTVTDGVVVVVGVKLGVTDGVLVTLACTDGDGIA